MGPSPVLPASESLEGLRSQEAGPTGGQGVSGQAQGKGCPWRHVGRSGVCRVGVV